MAGTVIAIDYGCLATPAALARVVRAERLVSDVRGDGGLGREPIAAELLCLEPASPCQEPEVGGAQLGASRRLAQRQQVVRQGGLEGELDVAECIRASTELGGQLRFKPDCATLAQMDTGQPRKYWAQRHGAEGGRLSQPAACRLFRSLVEGFVEQGYYQEWFGFSCVDDGAVPGLAGADIEAFALRKTRLDGLWPASDAWLTWDRLHLMTAVELLHDTVSKPEDGRYHDWAKCGWHYNKFDRAEGQRTYRSEVNSLLADLDDGYELKGSGEVVHKLGEHVDDLLQREMPATADSQVRSTINEAVRKFRRATTSPGDRRDAVRDLADVLELLRPRLKAVLSEPDEDALFNIANNFALRHMNDRQRTKYDRDVWLPWMFSFFLATIHAALALLEKREPAGQPAPGEPEWLVAARPTNTS